ncbi:MAG: cytidine deaminase [Lachnospiraceae bacterium]|jgi:cytidine deaminase|nr:cytidine deaminase [Lachnospiraceae bacterium]NBJ81324.1 cytidine deaminase [bacterium 1XD42-76]NBK04767.1 cytidine deaminase [bacterium 1XD42-94]
MEHKKLIQAALEARIFSYSPYSGFAVGAALLCEDGSVYTGCNIENAAFTPTNCAERTAFFKAVSEGKRRFKAVAIVGGPAEKEPETLCSPCGVCRQVMMEFCCPQDFLVILGRADLSFEEYRLCELLPLGFAGDGVKKSGEDKPV